VGCLSVESVLKIKDNMKTRLFLAWSLTTCGQAVDSIILGKFCAELDLTTGVQGFVIYQIENWNLEFKRNFQKSLQNLEANGLPKKYSLARITFILACALDMGLWCGT